VPKSTTASIEQRLEVMTHMRAYKIPMDLQAFLAAMHLCEEYGSAKYALAVIRQFVIDYKGIPFHRGLFIDFFTVGLLFFVSFVIAFSFTCFDFRFHSHCGYRHLIFRCLCDLTRVSTAIWRWCG
jgi:hypothetical protein